MQKEIIVITGSSGQLGKTIAQLLAVDYNIVGFDLVGGAFTNRLGNLTDFAKIKEITFGASAIIHTASLHAPHIQTHSRENFIHTNIKGTLYLLEAAKQNKVRKLIYTRTTSLYGESLNDPEKAAWITEEVRPVARDIYDSTKIAAEELCQDFFDPENLQTVSLRIARFWDEPLDKKVFYRMYRGLDVRDAALAHKLALKANFTCFEVFNISAQSVFEITDVVALRKNLHQVLAQRYPLIIDFYARQHWELPPQIDRVYVIDKAKKLLAYHPLYNVDALIEELKTKPAATNNSTNMNG